MCGWTRDGDLRMLGKASCAVDIGSTPLSNPLGNPRNGVSRGWMQAGTLLGVLLTCGPAVAGAQTCTTQARMTSVLRDELSGEAMNLAQSVEEGDAAKVQADTIAEFASGSSFCAYGEPGAVDVCTGCG